MANTTLQVLRCRGVGGGGWGVGSKSAPALQSSVGENCPWLGPDFHLEEEDEGIIQRCQTVRDFADNGL